MSLLRESRGVKRGGVAADVCRARGDSGRGAWHAWTWRAQREPASRGAGRGQGRGAGARAAREMSHAVLVSNTVSNILFKFHSPNYHSEILLLKNYFLYMSVTDIIDPQSCLLTD